MSELPDVSVVIPVRDGAASVEAAVRSALAQDYDGTIEVILAEGRSDDASRAVIDRIARSEPSVSVVDNPTGLTAAGLNRAIQAGTGQVIVRCDAHAELPPGYLEAAVRRLESTGAGVVGGVQDAVGETPVERAVAYAMANPLGSGGAAYRTPGVAGVVETVYLGVFRRSVLAEVGLFDETLIRSQDYELNHRIAAAGHGVFFAPELVVRYRPRGSLGGLWRQYFSYGRWKRLLVKRSPRALRLRQLAAPALILALVASLGLLLSSRPWLGALVPVAYGAALVAASIGELLRRRDRAALLVGVVLAVMHTAWGVGFWRAGTGNPEPHVPRLDA